MSDPHVSARSAALAEIYAQVPAMECKQLCQDSCRDVPLLKLERELLDLPAQMDVCPKLNGLGLCSIHEERPLLCRLWGVAPNMPCPHGCQPSRPLAFADAVAIVSLAEQIGGDWSP